MSGFNATPEFDQRIADWLETDPNRAPQAVLETVLATFPSIPQRPASRVPWRSTQMNRLILAGVVTAAVVAAVLGGSLLISTPPPVATTASPSSAPDSPAPSHSSSLAPVVKHCDGDATAQCAGPLIAGSHSTANFAPAFSFAVPEGWENTLDRDRAYTLKPPAGTFFFQILSQVAIPEQTASCRAARKPGAGTSVADWVEFLTTHPGLVASNAEPVSVGGYPGMRVQFRVGTQWSATCPRSIGPAVMLVTDTGSPPDRVVWVDDQISTFTVVDVRGTTVIIRLESGPTVQANDRDRQVVQPIVDSIEFAPAN